LVDVLWVGKREAFGVNNASECKLRTDGCAEKAASNALVQVVVAHLLSVLS